MQNQPGSDWVLADSQVLAKWIWSGSKTVYKNHLAHFRPTLLSQSGSDADQIWHVYWVHCHALISTMANLSMLPYEPLCWQIAMCFHAVIIIPGLTWMLLNALVVALADPSVLSFLDPCTCKKIIVIKKFCKAPTQQFKARNKHYITHIMHIKVENVICKLSNS